MGLTLTVGLGTSSAKPGLFDKSCTLLKIAVQEYRLQIPYLDLAEIDPEEYFQAFLHGVRDLFSEGNTPRPTLMPSASASRGRPSWHWERTGARS